MKILKIAFLFFLFYSVAASSNNITDIIEKNRVIYNYYSEQCGDLMADAMQKCIDDLALRKQQLIEEDKLQVAVSLKKLIKKISDDDIFSNDDFQTFPQEIQIVCNTYLHRKKQVEQLYKDSAEKLKKKILKEVSDSGQSKSTIESLKKIFNSDKFDFLDVEEILTTGKSEKISNSAEKEKTSDERSAELDEILKSAFPLANNLMASNIGKEKGKLLFLFIEKIQPDNKKIKALRRNAELKNYIPIAPTVMSEKQFIDKLEQLCSSFLNCGEQSEIARFCAALLLYLHPDSKLKSQINSAFDNPDIHTVLHYDDNLFGGSEEAEDLKLQLSIAANKEEIKKIYKQAEKLKQKYPNNQDVQDLIEEVEKKQDIKIENIDNSKKKQNDSNLLKKNNEKKLITCPKCQGKKKILCPQCIGSGISTEQEICPECHGKGKNWLGVKCKKCNGTGFVKQKMKCLNCNGTGKIVCPECNGTGEIPVDKL